ncbi:MAG: 6-carboxytetrahydropterin synthase QueD [Candidatus Bathyarchaeia archaeon]
MMGKVGDVGERYSYVLSVKEKFDSAHYLRGYPGKCAEVHGHTWEVEVAVEGRRLDGLGMLIDLRILKRVLRDVIDLLDHKLLNDLSFFDPNPTVEVIGRWIFERVEERMKEMGEEIRLVYVKVSEGPSGYVTVLRRDL